MGVCAAVQATEEAKKIQQLEPAADLNMTKPVLEHSEFCMWVERISLEWWPRMAPQT